ncbi:MAG: hypothetical protein JW849_02175 [Phycisphaerae bacterium]|nr:hypothetical protein [Phycisphaerae bacterium]
MVYVAGQGEVLRVGWVAGSETLGRQSIFLASWAAELARQGIQPCVFCPQNAPTGVLEADWIHRYAQPHWLARKADKTRGLAEAVLSAEVDVLHALDESAASRTAAAADRLGRPYFLGCYRIGSRFHLPHKARRLAGYLAAGDPIYQDMHKRRIVGEETVHLFRPGVWIAEEPKPLAFEERHAMILADVYNASASDADAVLRCFLNIRNAGSGALFFLLHSDSQERSLRRRAETLGLLSDLTFVVQDAGGRAMHVIQSTDVFIAAGARKEFDWGALLAMAAGAPVLASRTDEGDFLHDGMTASLFSPGDEEGLTALLTNLLTTPAWGRAQARSALQYLHVYHNPFRCMSDLANLYRAACAPAEEIAPKAEPQT